MEKGESCGHLPHPSHPTDWTPASQSYSLNHHRLPQLLFWILSWLLTAAAPASLFIAKHIFVYIYIHIYICCQARCISHGTALMTQACSASNTVVVMQWGRTLPPRLCACMCKRLCLKTVPPPSPSLTSIAQCVASPICRNARRVHPLLPPAARFLFFLSALCLCLGWAAEHTVRT